MCHFMFFSISVIEPNDSFGRPGHAMSKMQHKAGEILGIWHKQLQPDIPSRSMVSILTRIQRVRDLLKGK